MNIHYLSNETTSDPFTLTGSEVDIPMTWGNIDMFPDKKAIYALDAEGNKTRGLGIVGHEYPFKNAGNEEILAGERFTPHVTFFKKQQDMLQKMLPAGHLDRLEVTYKTARHGAWALQETVFPSIRVPITTYKHKTEMGLRHITWHGVDGLTSNNGLFGGIDFFCSNGTITGEYDRVRRKNTKRFDMNAFVEEIEQSLEVFYERAKMYQAWASRTISEHQAQELFGAMFGVRKAPKMLEIYHSEAAIRGNTLWTVYSTFTNYASHEDTFALNDTGGDHKAQSMLKREFEVSALIEHDAFTKLAA